MLGMRKVRVELKYVECPNEKKVPTVTGRWPAAIRRRVIRSMACMYQPQSLYFECIDSGYRDVICVESMSQT
jgi:hypothetical protein